MAYSRANRGGDSEEEEEVEYRGGGKKDGEYRRVLKTENKQYECNWVGEKSRRVWRDRVSRYVSRLSVV